MANITFVMQPEMGHVLPTVRIATILRQRGHQIRYVSPPFFASFIEQHGFLFTPLLESFVETRAAGRAGASKTPRDLVASLGISSEKLWQEILNSIHCKPFDLVLVDSGLITVSSASALSDLRSRLMRINTSLPDNRQGPLPYSIPELVLCPEAFDLPGRPSVTYERHFVEPSIFRDRNDQLTGGTSLDPAKPFIYCAIGTQGAAYTARVDFVNKVIHAFSELRGAQLLVATGTAGWKENHAGLPSNVNVCEHVNQLAVLRHASLFITHGGLGSIKEAIFARVPMVVAPFLFDQPLNARRVEHHGIGRALNPGQWSAEDFRAAVLSGLDDDEQRRNIAGLHDIFAKIEEESPSIGHIERLLALQ